MPAVNTSSIDWTAVAQQAGQTAVQVGSDYVKNKYLTPASTELPASNTAPVQGASAALPPSTKVSTMPKWIWYAVGAVALVGLVFVTGMHKRLFKK
jgi:hypothetical protein